MADEQRKTRIEEAKERLYRRDFKMRRDSTLQDIRVNKQSVPETWDDNKDDKLNEESIEQVRKKNMKLSIFKKMFIASVVFFVIALGIASYFFFSGNNVVSPDNVVIGVRGPASIDGGDELSLKISITNNNNTALKFTDLLVEYPKGTRSADSVSEELLRYRESLDEIGVGESVNKVVRAVLFGEEGQTSNIKITLEYRVDGSNAIFVKEKTYSIKIVSSPVNVSMKMLKEINSNQEMSLEIEVSSNSDSVVKNLVLLADYPSGFKPTSAIPESAYGNNIWKLGDMSPKSKKTIKIIGVMSGQDTEEKIFGINVGKQSPKNEREIAVVYSSSFKSVLIKKPFLGATLLLNGSSENKYTVNDNDIITGTISWINNLPTKIANAVIEVKFDGNILDKFSVSVDGGVYNSSTNTIIWNKNSLPDLASIESGATGRMNFRFSPKSLIDTSVSNIRNPEINISVSVKGRRISENGTTEDIKDFVKREILVNSDLRLMSRIIYYGGRFANTGPIPPASEKTTTYTVLWSVSNSSNDVSNAKVRAVLPAYANWVGAFYPPNEDISFNNLTGEVLWDVGKIKAGEGILKSGREISFQVSLVPSVSHIGKVPDIVSNIVLTGEDDYTSDTVEFKGKTLTTNLSTDPSFNYTDAQVVK